MKFNLAIAFSQDGSSIISLPKKVNYDSHFTITSSGQTLSFSQPVLERATIYPMHFDAPFSGTRYYPMMELPVAASSVADFHRVYMQAGVFDALYVTTNVISGNGIMTIKLMVDGAETALSATTTTGSGNRWSTASDIVNQITIADGQYVCMQVTKDGSNFNETNVTINFRPL